MEFERVVILDLDSLRPDVFQYALRERLLPNFETITRPGEEDITLHVPVVSVAPSITFAAQASLFTGAHPAQHRIPGNLFYDRLGHISGGQARFYGLEGGETKDFDDAVAAFSSDLCDHLLSHEVQTIYESVADAGKISLVVGNMYNRGAQHEILPSLADIARIFYGFGPLKMTPADCDDKSVFAFGEYLHAMEPKPDLTTVYLVGLDLYTHDHGPEKQLDYACESFDKQIGNVIEILKKNNLFEGTLFIFCSDHGQISTPGDDAHAISMGFAADKELTPLFTAHGLDLYDLPGEDPHVDAVMGLNGGMAYVYLKNMEDSWSAFPRFDKDVLPIAQAFHEMNRSGKYRAELQDTMDLILIRDVEHSGDWYTNYQVYLGDERFQSFEEWLEEHPEVDFIDPINRIRYAASPMSGDLILHAKTWRGVNFGAEGKKGVHGSLHKEDSCAVLAFAYPTGTRDEIDELHHQVTTLIQERCQREHNRQPSITDMAYVLRKLWLKQ
jgi:hypothetical protein